MHIDIIEAIWLLINSVVVILTILARHEAKLDEVAVKKLNGKARELAASSITRRETLRLITQLLITSLVFPGMFIARPTPINYTTVVLIFIPMIILYSTIRDAQDRRILTKMVIRDNT